MCGQFVRLLQEVLLGNSVVTQVKPIRCLGIEFTVILIRAVSPFHKIESSHVFAFLPNYSESWFIFQSNFTIFMGWLYGVPATNRSLMSGRGYTYVSQISSMAWIGTHPAIRSKPKASGPLLKIYKNIDYFHNFCLFLFEAACEMTANITCEGNWPFCYQNQHWNSPLVHFLQSRTSMEFSWQSYTCNLKQKHISKFLKR